MNKLIKKKIGEKYYQDNGRIVIGKDIFLGEVLIHHRPRDK